MPRTRRKKPAGAGDMQGKISKPTKSRSSSNQTKPGSKGSFGRFGIVLNKKKRGTAPSKSGAGKRPSPKKPAKPIVAPVSAKGKKHAKTVQARTKARLGGNPGNAKNVGGAGEKGPKFNPPPSGPGTKGASDGQKKKDKPAKNGGGGNSGGGGEPKEKKKKK